MQEYCGGYETCALLISSRSTCLFRFRFFLALDHFIWSYLRKTQSGVSVCALSSILFLGIHAAVKQMSLDTICHSPIRTHLVQIVPTFTGWFMRNTNTVLKYQYFIVNGHYCVAMDKNCSLTLRQINLWLCGVFLNHYGRFVSNQSTMQKKWNGM